MENELKKELTDTMDDLKGHFELYVDLYKLKTAKRVSEILSKVLKAFIFISLSETLRLMVHLVRNHMICQWLTWEKNMNW